MTIYRTFAERLAESMRQKAWTQAQAAREVTRHLPDGQTFDPANLNYYLKGRGEPGPKYRQALIRALDLEVGSEKPSALRHYRPSPRGGPAPGSIRLEDLGEEALVRVNKRVSWPIALKVLDLLQGRN